MDRDELESRLAQAKWERRLLYRGARMEHFEGAEGSWPMELRAEELNRRSRVIHQLEIDLSRL